MSSSQAAPSKHPVSTYDRLKMLFVTKPDIFCIPCKLRVCKFPKNSMDVNYISEDFWCLILNLKTCTVVIHTIFWKFINLRLTSPSGPIRYSILKVKTSFVPIIVNLFNANKWKLHNYSRSPGLGNNGTMWEILSLLNFMNLKNCSNCLHISATRVCIKPGEPP